MYTKQFIAITLTTMLFMQLGMIQVHFNAPQLSFGQLSERVIAKVKTLTYRPSFAELTAQSEKSFNTMVFVGDVMLARNVEQLMRAKGNKYPFASIDLKDGLINPAIVGNFEAAIPREHVPTPIKQLDFSVDGNFLSTLYDEGFTHVSLANNHAFDFGVSDYEHTRVKLHDNNVVAFGDPNGFSEVSIEYLKVEDTTIALIGINEFYKGNFVEAGSQALRQSKTKSDLQIVYVHWGIEYDLRHSKKQREAAEIFVENGADLIVGHHPHVVQDIDLINGVPVFYSLGNFIFDQYFSKDVQEGLVLQMSLDIDGVDVYLLPVTSYGRLSQPVVMNGKEHAEFLNTLARKSNQALAGQIKKGLISIDTLVATSTKLSMID